MDGLNKAYKKDPRGFLRKHALDARGSINSPAPPVTGIYDFDLSYDPRKNGCVFLQKFDERGKAATDKTNRISAYWLPWASNQTTEIDLGNQADFFFTSALGGCQIRVAGNKVLHIAGDSQGGSTEKGSKWREKQARAKLGNDFAQSRRLSSRFEYAETGLAIFVGFRKNNIWQFVAQAVSVDEESGKWSGEEVEMTLGGTVFKEAWK